MFSLEVYIIFPHAFLCVSQQSLVIDERTPIAINVIDNISIRCRVSGDQLVGLTLSPVFGFLDIGSGLYPRPRPRARPGQALCPQELQARKRRQHKSKHVTNSCYASKIPRRLRRNACRSLTSWCKCCQRLRSSNPPEGNATVNGNLNGVG